MTVFLLILALEFPALIAVADCYNRAPGDFPGGADDRRSWIRWLWVAVATNWLLVGNAILLGYYWIVIKRRTPLGRG